jgi:hypothetical protein
MPFLTLDSQPKGSDLIRHIEHVANVAGEDHVGIGTDNGVLPMAIDAEARRKNREWAMARIKAGIASPGEGPDVFPIVADYNSVDRYRRLADGLARRGWSPPAWRSCSAAISSGSTATSGAPERLEGNPRKREPDRWARLPLQVAVNLERSSSRLQLSEYLTEQP